MARSCSISASSEAVISEVVNEMPGREHRCRAFESGVAVDEHGQTGQRTAVDVTEDQVVDRDTTKLRVVRQEHPVLRAERKLIFVEGFAVEGNSDGERRQHLAAGQPPQRSAAQDAVIVRLIFDETGAACDRGEATVGRRVNGDASVLVVRPGRQFGGGVDSGRIRQDDATYFRGTQLADNLAIEFEFVFVACPLRLDADDDGVVQRVAGHASREQVVDEAIDAGEERGEGAIDHQQEDAREGERNESDTGLFPGVVQAFRSLFYGRKYRKLQGAVMRMGRHFLCHKGCLPPARANYRGRNPESAATERAASGGFFI